MSFLLLSLRNTPCLHRYAIIRHDFAWQRSAVQLGEVWRGLRPLQTSPTCKADRCQAKPWFIQSSKPFHAASIGQILCGAAFE